MDTSNIDTVFVAGKAMKRNGELNHVDWTAVKKAVIESREYVMKKSGFKLPPIQTKTLLQKFYSYKDEDRVKQTHCQARSTKSPYLKDNLSNKIMR